MALPSMESTFYTIKQRFTVKKKAKTMGIIKEGFTVKV